MVVNLEKILRFKPKVVVFFADMQPIENFCSQYLNFIPSVKTVTLQHGLYVEYLNYDTINTVNYTNQVSEYFLSWGKSTSDLIKKYNPATKTIICGKPVNYVSGRKLDDYITVVFDQPIFDDYNAEMYRISLAFAEKYGKNLCVRFHPNSDKNKFKLIFGEMNDEIKETSSSLYICHTSTVLVELMHLNHNVAIFDSEIPTLDYPNELKFNSVTSLEKVIINTKQLNTFELSKGYIDCAGLKSKHEYGIALNKILNA